MNFNRRKKDFFASLQSVLRTPDGQKLFKYLKEDYIDTSAIQPSVEMTYYKLGQKELIQGLLADSQVKEEDFEAVKVVNLYED